MFTCAGKRVDVIQAFQRAGATTLVAEMNELAPAARAADLFEPVPAVGDEAYVAKLAEIVRQQKITLILPLSDLDQGVLAQSADELGSLGALVLLPGPDVIAITRDKWRMHEFLHLRGFDSPDTWLPEALPDDLDFPIVVKRRFGFGGEGLHWAYDRSELDFFLRYSAAEKIALVPQDVIVQAALDSRAEFSIDVFCDVDGRCLNAIPRSMLESKGGESIKGMTIEARDLVEHGRRVAEALRLVGPATIQCFRVAGDRLPVTDVNVRFGGAFPLPTRAGSRYPELALALAAGERPRPSVGVYSRGVYMARYYTETFEVALSEARA
jgi:carbamoyl-phosphate synthase large subunit